MLVPVFWACSAVRLSYNQGPTLAYWWLDRYADFGVEQSARVKAALADWFAWHRATQLADYTQALGAMQALAVDKVSAGQVCGNLDAWKRRAEASFERAVPAMAELVRDLSPEQISRIERRQHNNHEERKTEYLQAVPADRTKATFERALSRAESLYGTLDDAQRRLLTGGLAASPFNPERWLDEQAQRQADIVRSLRRWTTERSDTATVQAGLRRLAAEAVKSPDPQYAAYAHRLTDANCALLARVHNSTNPAQRQHATDKLRGWEDDLRALLTP